MIAQEPRYSDERLQAAYEAGVDARKNGPNTTNCSFRHFATPEMRDAWSEGNRVLDKKKA